VVSCPSSVVRLQVLLSASYLLPPSSARVPSVIQRSSNTEATETLRVLRVTALDTLHQMAMKVRSRPRGQLTLDGCRGYPCADCRDKGPGYGKPYPYSPSDFFFLADAFFVVPKWESV